MLVRHWACGHLSKAAVADHSAIIAAMRTPNLRRVLPLAVALVAPVVLLAQERLAPGALPSAERPFGTLREQAAHAAGVAEEAARHVPAGADAQARHRPLGRADARVQRGPGVHRDHRARDVRRAAADDLRVLRQVRRRRRRRRRPRASSASRSAARRRAACSTRARSTKAAAGNVGRGRQAELWGDEQWQALKAGRSRSASRSVIGIDRSTVFAFTDGLSSGELQGMTAALGATWTAKFKDAEGLPLELIASRLPEEEAFFQQDERARLADDADDVLRQGRSCRAQTRTSDLVWWWRQRVERSGPRHVVPAEHRSAAAGRDRRSSSATIRSSSRATCCTATSASRSRASTPTRSTWPTCCARARPTRPPGCKRALANAQRDAGHRDGGDPAGPHRQRDPRRRARAHEGARASTARCTRIRSA